MLSPGVYFRYGVAGLTGYRHPATRPIPAVQIEISIFRKLPFALCHNFARSGLDGLYENDKVEYDLESGRDGKESASNLKLLSD